MTRIHATGAITLVALLSILAALPASAQTAPAAGGGRPTIPAWVFKPKAAPYEGPNRPVWHVADIIGAHKGKPDWSQTVVKDRWFENQYVSMGPGKKTRTSFQADTLSWFVVHSGEIRVSIKGQDPFVASKDFIVQIPMRTPYSLETVSQTPSVRLEVRTADAAIVYPIADNPEPPPVPPGFEAVRVNVGAPGQSAAASVKTALDFDKDMVANPVPRAPGGGNTFFVRDSRGFAVPIRSAPTTVAATDIGHFHTGLAEFWYVLEGDMDVRIEGIKDLVHAHQGDIVYAPMGRYHRTIMVGAPMSTRLAMGSVTDSGASFTPYEGQ
jgi:mannose-6-phosphate isomerase-like protein (cupin superfamily)